MSGSAKSEQGPGYQHMEVGDVEKNEPCVVISEERQSSIRRKVIGIVHHFMKIVLTISSLIDEFSRLFVFCTFYPTWIEVNRCPLFVMAIAHKSPGNIGNAKTAGLGTDLGLSDYQWSWVLYAFYICYIVFEWTTVLWKILPAHCYVAVLCIWYVFHRFHQISLKSPSWGAAAMCSGAVNTFAQILVTRSLLGIFESIFGCGAPYFLSLFYQRKELGLRVSLLLGMSPVANCFASALAYGITHIRGSMESWRYLFIIGAKFPPPSPLTTNVANRGCTDRSIFSYSILLSPRLPRNSPLPKRIRANRSRRASTSVRHNGETQSSLVSSAKRIKRLQKLRSHGYSFLLQLLFCRIIQFPPFDSTSNGIHVHQRARPRSPTIPSLLPVLRSSGISLRQTS